MAVSATRATRAIVERRFKVMGTDAHLIVTGDDGCRHLEHAEFELHQLERLWSRFLPSSEISQLNQAGGDEVVLSTSTFQLVQKAVSGWRLTAGRYNPMLLDQLTALGYDRTFSEVGSSPHRDSSPKPQSPRPPHSSGCDEIVFDLARRSVRLPAGHAFDPGGIGKGLAADHVAHRVMNAGAAGVMVNLGGDLRVMGQPPSGDRWVVSIREPAHSELPVTTVQLIEGGLATSTTLRRTWKNAEGEQHHLIDPATGAPHRHGCVLATAITGAGWWSEVAATALIGGTDPEWEDLPGCAAMRVMEDGTQYRSGRFEQHELQQARFR